MSNIAAKQDDVTNAADSLMQRLLSEASTSTDLEFSVQVMQAATRYLAVKSRINVPDEGNAFDGFRSDISGAGGAAAALAAERAALLPSGGSGPASGAAVGGADAPSPGGKKARRTAGANGSALAVSEPLC